MSASWESGIIDQESIKAQKRVLRMWLYLSIGAAFYIFLRIKVGV